LQGFEEERRPCVGSDDRKGWDGRVRSVSALQHGAAISPVLTEAW